MRRGAQQLVLEIMWPRFNSFARTTPVPFNFTVYVFEQSYNRDKETRRG